jgi:selenocysteine-specific elongation factor
MSEPLTLGTAGHIDHGKTALVSALTGADTDRLPAERERGISIELGFAPLTLPSGRQLSVVDVPGHERFVRTMVAGATGIDLYLMVVAADDGVMPQTREHAAVLRALGIETGVVAITKCDLADPSRALAQTRDLLPEAEAVPVSTRTGVGLLDLVAALQEAADTVQSRATAPGPARLHIDRVFTIKGAGTVATGTLWSGTISRGDTLTVLPAGTPARVRGVQIHDEPADTARAGQRVALNLAIDLDQVARGDVLTPTGVTPTRVIDAALDLPDDIEHGARVQVHHGTRESPARLAELGGRFWQVRLERPLIAVQGDRLVVRRISPPDTLGGGTVLDAHARRHGASRDSLSRLTRLARGEPADLGGWSTNVAQDAQIVDQPASGGRPRPVPAIPPPAVPPAPLTDQSINLEERLRAASFAPPPNRELDAGDLAALRAHGRAVCVNNLHFHPDAIADARNRAVALANRNGGSLTLAALRDELGVSRRYAEALLSHLAATRVFVRRGDVHELRRAHIAPASEPGRTAR